MLYFADWDVTGWKSNSYLQTGVVSVSYGCPMLGEILCEKFGLPPGKLNDVLEIQTTKEGLLGELLLKRRLIRAASTSSWPKVPHTRATAAETSSKSRTSARTRMAFPPACSIS